MKRIIEIEIDCCGDCLYYNWKNITVEKEQKKRKTGKWEFDAERSKGRIEKIYVCSNCKTFEAWGESEKTNYCPHCGARMEK